MHRLSAIALIAAALGVAAANAQPAPATPSARTVKVVKPGLLEVTGTRLDEANNAGIVKIAATPGKGMRSIEVQSPWGNSYFNWPKDVKPVAFTIEHAKKTGTVLFSAPGLTEANKEDYKKAVDAVVPRAISMAGAMRKLYE
jgi:hypothetical protein